VDANGEGEDDGEVDREARAPDTCAQAMIVTSCLSVTACLQISLLVHNESCQIDQIALSRCKDEHLLLVLSTLTGQDIE